MKLVPAKWFHAGRLKPVRLIVIHCTVSPEMGTGAEAVAAYFAKGDRRASAHRVADNNSTVQCVKDEDTAFGAAGANSDGLHLELVGQPSQTKEEWLDPYSTSELKQAGPTMREWSTEFHIPLRWLTVAQVADGKTAGLCTHHDVSRAFPDVSTGHWDPGPNFPKAEALRLWTPAPPVTAQEGGMFSYEYDAAGAAPNVLVVVESGKQVRITNNTVLDRRRAAKESHYGPVDKSEFDAFEKAWGPVIGL